MARKTGCDIALELISRPGGATGLDIIHAGVLNYKGRVSDLRRRGHAIKTTMTSGTRRDGTPCVYAVYTIDEEESA